MANRRTMLRDRLDLVDSTANGPGGACSSVASPGGAVDAADAQQPAQRHQPPRLVVDQAGVLLEDLVPAAAGRVLQLEDRLGAEQVRLALAPPLVLAAGVQPPVVHPGARAGWRGRVRGPISAASSSKPDAAQPRGGAGEAGLDDLGAQADRLEDLRAGVGGDGGHAHLGHDLQQALAERLDQVRLGLLCRDVLASTPRRTRSLTDLDGQVGVDGGGAVPDEQRDVVALADVPGLHHQADPGPCLLPDQVVVHRTGQQQRRDRAAEVGRPSRPPGGRTGRSAGRRRRWRPRPRRRSRPAGRAGRRPPPAGS